MFLRGSRQPGNAHESFSEISIGGLGRNISPLQDRIRRLGIDGVILIERIYFGMARREGSSMAETANQKISWRDW